MGHLIIDSKTHDKLAIRARIEHKRIGKLTIEIINQYLIRKDGEDIRNIPPETIEIVKEEIKKLFLTKEGERFKTIKKYWTEDLIKKILPNLEFGKDIIFECIGKLIEGELLVNNYKNEVRYNWELQENIDSLVSEEI